MAPPSCSPRSSVTGSPILGSARVTGAGLLVLATFVGLAIVGCGDLTGLGLFYAEWVQRVGTS